MPSCLLYAVLLAAVSARRPAREAGAALAIGVAGCGLATARFWQAGFGEGCRRRVSACLVIAGAGLTCLALVQRWGAALPGALRHGVAWFGGLLGILHAVVFCAMAAARLLGWADYPSGSRMTAAQLHAFDVANLVYFEPWFAVMGALLIATSVSARRPRLARRDRRLPAPRDGEVGWGCGQCRR